MKPLKRILSQIFPYSARTKMFMSKLSWFLSKKRQPRRTGSPQNSPDTNEGTVAKTRSVRFNVPPSPTDDEYPIDQMGTMDMLDNDCIAVSQIVTANADLMVEITSDLLALMAGEEDDLSEPPPVARSTKPTRQAQFYEME